jgi:hypothetical protein
MEKLGSNCLNVIYGTWKWSVLVLLPIKLPLP